MEIQEMIMTVEARTNFFGVQLAEEEDGVYIFDVRMAVAPKKAQLRIVPQDESLIIEYRTDGDWVRLFNL